MEIAKKKPTSMSVIDMGRLLGLGKTESYRLVKQQYFKTITVGHRMRVMVDSFEEWYANQCWYRKADGTPPGENIKKTTFSAAELGTLLGVSEATAYELMAKGYFTDVEVLGKRRITQESFERWYSSQTVYRTVADQKHNESLILASYSMPEISKMLGIHRNSVYYIVGSHDFEFVYVGRQKRISKESFHSWLESQTHYKIRTEG